MNTCRVTDSQEVEPPVYLLAGDEDGYLSVLPARHDSKFFEVDVWKASLKHQVKVSLVRRACVPLATAQAPSR